MEKLDYSNGFGAVWDLIRDANSYIEDRQPWALNKAGDTAAAAAVLGDCLEALRVVALLASPLIPRASAELWRRLGLPGAPRRRAAPRRGRRGACLPAGADAGEGRAAVPPHRDVTWVDSHCHLPSLSGGADAALDRAAGGGRGRRRVRGHRPRNVTGVDRGRRARTPTCAPPSGLHPHDASKLAGRVGRARGAGEHARRSSRSVRPGSTSTTGTRRPTSRKLRSARRSRWRIELGLALVIHTRDAWDDTFRVLADEGVPDRTVFHCFTGGPDEARRALALGAYLSFSGIVSFKNADDVRAAAALTPLDRMLVETDAPYLAPVPHRGRENEPAWVVDVGAALAAATGRTVDEIAAATADERRPRCSGSRERPAHPA